MTSKRILLTLATITMAWFVDLAAIQSQDAQEMNSSKMAATKEFAAQINELVETARPLIVDRKFDEALDVWAQIVALERQVLGKQHPDVAESLDMIARL